MNYAGHIISDIINLLRVFTEHSSETTTMKELAIIIEDDERWVEAHALFGKIRQKTLKVEQKDSSLHAQYLFEEVCAKTIYNLSNSTAPFDADSPYWIIPNAFALTKHLNISEQLITEQITDATKLIAETEGANLPVRE